MLQPISKLQPANPQPQPQGSGRVIDPLRSLRNHPRIAAAVFLAVLLGGLPYAWLKGAPVWRSEGVLYVAPRFPSNLETSQEHELQSNTQYREFVQQQVRTVNRFDIVSGVLHRAGIMAKWRKPAETEHHAVQRLQSALQIAAVPDTYQVTVGLEGNQPAPLAEIVNAVMADFTETARKELLWDANGRLAKLNAEKANLEAEIAGLTERKSGLASQLGTTVFSEGVINSYDRRLASALDALEDARRQRFAAEGALSGQAAPGVAATAMEKALGDAGLSSLRSALNQRKAALLTSIQGLAPQHNGRIAAEKEIKDIDSQIDRLTSQAHDRWQSGLENINLSKYEQARQLEAKVQHEVDQLKAQTESFSRGYQSTLDVGDEISRARRRLSAIEDRINFLMLETAAPGFVRVFSAAMRPEEPLQGGRKKLGLIVLLAALALAVAAPAGIDLLDPRIMTARELEASAGMPVSAELHAIEPANTVPGARRFAVVLRRHLRHLPRKTLVFTSLSDQGYPGIVAAAAGRELKKLGLRPLIVDTISRSSGGHGGVDDQVVPGAGGAADRMPAGSFEEVDLLAADALLAAIERNAAYDVVLVVAAPVAHSLVAEEFVRAAGAVMLVVATAWDTKAKLREAIALLTRLQTAAFGMVLNTVTGRRSNFSSPIQSEEDNDTADLLAA